jgi:hypothetical protein
MSHLIAWCAFLGGWLLVAGPVYQSTIELADEEFEREEFIKAAKEVERPQPVSRWWLLVPPVAWFLRRRRAHGHRDALLHVLTPLQTEQLLHYVETSTAWAFVGLGAALLAIAETWHLAEVYEWPDPVFGALVVLMLVLCGANTSMRVNRRQAILEQANRDGAR